MKKINLKTNKFKFLIDVIVNIIAFGIYVFAMQIIFLPFMANYLDITENSKLLTYIIILNLFTLSIGQQLGITLQVFFKNPKESEQIHDFNYLNIISNISVFIITFIITFLLKYGFILSLTLSIITTLTNNRFYFVSFFRQNKDFKNVTWSNIYYFIGMILGILYCYFINLHFWLPILLAEIFSNIFVFLKLKNYFSIKAKKGKSFTIIVKDYANLVLSAFLQNIPSYLDKLLVLPLLGPESMSIYYAGTTLSKVLFLLVNPINGVVLAWLATSTNNNPKNIINKYIKVNFLIIIVCFILSIPFTYLATMIMYNKFFSAIKILIVPISLTSSFQISSSLLRVMLLNYYNSKFTVTINTVSIITFLIFGSLGALKFGLIGFAWGLTLSKLSVWIMYIFIMTTNKIQTKKLN